MGRHFCVLRCRRYTLQWARAQRVCIIAEFCLHIMHAVSFTNQSVLKFHDALLFEQPLDSDGAIRLHVARLVRGEGALCLCGALATHLDRLNPELEIQTWIYMHRSKNEFGCAFIHQSANWKP